MSGQKLLEGRNFRLLRQTAAGPPAVFKFLCLFSSLQHELNIQSERFPLPNCTTPSQLPAMFTSISAVGDTITANGRVDTVEVKALEAIARAGTAAVYQLLVSATAADGGGTLTGSFRITNFQKGTNDGATCTVSMTIASEGPAVWVDAA